MVHSSWPVGCRWVLLLVSVVLLCSVLVVGVDCLVCSMLDSLIFCSIWVFNRSVVDSLLIGLGSVVAFLAGIGPRRYSGLFFLDCISC